MVSFLEALNFVKIIRKQLSKLVENKITMMMGAIEELIQSNLSSFSADGGVYLPDTPGYDACLLAAAGANYACLHERRRPPIAILPACERDVVLAIRAIAEGKRRGLWPNPEVAMTVCGGGHSELGVVDGAVLLHMGRMAAVLCHPRAGPDH